MGIVKKPIKLDGVSKTLVLIDAGHGGIIDGVYTTAPSKMYDHGSFTFFEGVYNRLIADRYIHYLDKNGINYMFLTDTNEDVPLKHRTDKINSIVMGYPEYDPYLVSIHGNAAGVKKATGIEVYTTKGITKSDIYAEIFFKELKELEWKMRSDISDGDKDKEANFWMLKNTLCPAILLEIGFFTNKEQALNMMNPYIQDAIGQFLCEASIKCENLR